MTFWKNPTNWYWLVQDSSPSTQVWQSSTGQFVALADADYVAFLAATNPFSTPAGQPNIASSIDTMANLLLEINRYNQTLYNIAGLNYQVISPFAADTALTIPLPTWVDVINTTAAGKNLTLPQVNLFGGPPIGTQVVINSITGGNHGFNVKDFASNTIIAALPNEYIVLVLTAIDTKQGTWSAGYSVFHLPDPSAANQFPTSVASTDGNFVWSATTGAHGSFSPTDTSGAGLTFTSVNVQYTTIGNMVFVYGTLTYPATASGANSSISLPVAVPAASYAIVPSTASAAGIGAIGIVSLSGGSTAAFFNFTTGAQYTNIQLSTVMIRFMLVYPAA